MEDLKDKLVPISTSGGPTHVIAPLMPSQDTTPDQIAFFNRPNSVPYVRHSPLPVAASAQTNAVAKTIAKQVVAATPVVPAPATQVDLTMPAQYTVTESAVGSTEDIAVQWLPVTPGYSLMGPGPISALESIVSAGDSGGTINSSVLPTSIATTWALWVEFSNNNVVAGQPAGWTSLNSTSSQNIFIKSQTGSAPYVVSAALSAPAPFTAATLVFAGGIPSIVQSANVTIAGLSGSIVMSPVTAGDVIFAVIQGYNDGTVYALSVTDTQGNQYFQVSGAQIGPSGLGPAVSQGIFICPSAVSSGANTIQFVYTPLGTSGPPAHQEAFVMETGPLVPGPGLPFFRQIVPSDLPSLNDLPGIIPITKGGTGANLHTSGGTSQVVQQSTAGGPFSVAQLNYTDLAGVLENAILTFSAPLVAASQVGIGNGVATSATAGTNGAVPAQVVGYLIINVAGTDMKIPYFNI